MSFQEHLVLIFIYYLFCIFFLLWKFVCVQLQNNSQKLLCTICWHLFIVKHSVFFLFGVFIHMQNWNLYSLKFQQWQLNPMSGLVPKCQIRIKTSVSGLCMGTANVRFQWRWNNSCVLFHITKNVFNYVLQVCCNKHVFFVEFYYFVFIFKVHPKIACRNNNQLKIYRWRIYFKMKNTRWQSSVCLATMDW